MDWRVELDVFNGPLDLLLYLIKRDELDVFDIPIARITESYIAALNDVRHAHAAGALDIDTIGDFLVMAATLMEIKSATLLPTPPAVSEDGSPSAAEQLSDPRADLIRQLLEYKRFKDHASALEKQQQTFQSRFARVPAFREEARNPDELPPLDLDEVQIWDLMAAFRRLMGEIGERKATHEVIDDDAPLELHAADVEDRLQRFGTQTLRQLFTARRSRSEMIGVFLALLELIRQRKIVARFAEGGDDVAFETAPPEHQPPEQKAAEQKAAEQKAAEQKAADEESSVAASDAADLAHDLAESPEEVGEVR